MWAGVGAETVNLGSKNAFGQHRVKAVNVGRGGAWLQ